MDDLQAWAEAEAEAQEQERERERAEREALARVCDDVKVQSENSRLSTPAQWAEAGFVPAHMTAEDFEMFVYEFLEEERAAREVEAAAEEQAAAEAQAAAEESPDAPEAPAMPEPSASPAPDAPEPVIDSESIVVLVGAHSYYLYHSGIMTAAYAHWAFLAAEDNPMITLVDCAREDSRIYPRPLAAKSLRNPPFRMTDAQIAQAWEAVQASGDYPDIQRTVATNGAAYFYSTDYLSPVYAERLAQWDAVERRHQR